MNGRVAKATAPRARAYLMLAVGIIAYCVTIIQRTSMSVSGLFAVERFDVGPSLLSVFVFLQLLVYALCQVPVGLALDRLGARTVLATGALIAAAGQFVLAHTDTVGLALGARAVVGLGDAATFISAVRLVNFWFTGPRIPLMTQVIQMVGAAAQMVTAIPFAAVLIDQGWTYSYTLLAALGVVTAVLIATLTRNQPVGSPPTVSSLSQGQLITHLRETWSHPGTRLGFWTHFVTPVAAMTFAFLWGIPFLIRAQGLTQLEAGQLLSVMVVLGIAIGPVVGALVGRYPLRRSQLALGIVAINALMWTIVLLHSGPAPRWMLILLCVAMAFGGPGSMIGLDHARSWNPLSRLGAAQGLVNSGGFFAAVLSISGVGFVLEWAGDFSLDSFRLAFCVMYPLWLVGTVQVIRYRRKVRLLRTGTDSIN